MQSTDPNYLSILEADINLELQPVLEMLKHYKNKLSTEKWTALAERTRKSVLRHPHEYLTVELEPREAVKKAINIVFEEYLKSGFY